MSQRWKAYERRVARFFGSERVRGSGSGLRGRDNVEETASDSHHPKLYIEAKSVMANSGTNAWVWRLVRDLWPKRAMLWWCAKSQLYVAHTKSLEPGAKYQTWGTELKAACARLWKQTKELAAQEKKTPLLALCVKGKRGFWLVSDAEGILAAQKARKEVVERELQGKSEDAR